MSYARFGVDGSDVYVFATHDNHLECCGCLLRDDRHFQTETPAGMVAHLAEHTAAGHTVPAYTVLELGVPEEALALPARPSTPRATMDSIDAAVEGRCAGPGCTVELTDASPSAWWCSPQCQAGYQQQGAIRPEEIRGSEEVDPDRMRWRPNLPLDTWDDTGLVLLYEDTEPPFTRRQYAHTDGRPGWHLRLDDGHRYVGLDAGLEDDLEPVWERLRRELTDPRRVESFPVDGQPCACPICEAWRTMPSPSIRRGGIRFPGAVAPVSGGLPLDEEQRRLLEQLPDEGGVDIWVDAGVGRAMRVHARRRGNIIDLRMVNDPWPDGAPATPPPMDVDERDRTIRRITEALDVPPALITLTWTNTTGL